MQRQLLGVQGCDRITTPDGDEDLAQRRVSISQDGQLINRRTFHLPDGCVTGENTGVGLASESHDESLAGTPFSP